MEDKVIDFLKHEVSQKHIPGAVIQVTHKNKTIMREAVGYRIDTKTVQEPMALDTVFDLASLTKIVATLPAVLKLMDDGKIRLDDPVTLFLPKFSQAGKEDVKVRHLLTHTTGLPQHRSYHLDNLNKSEILEQIYQEELAEAPGNSVSYSDLGFIILHRLVEIVADKPFDQFLDEAILSRLEMDETGFNPTFAKKRYAATEYSESHGDYKTGVVHDENAESMGGISGHAGLFSTLKDLTKFVYMIENDGNYGARQILSSSALKLARTNFTSFDNEHRGLAWMLKNPELASCGDYFSKESYGHTGFTGTSLWFDPEIDLSVILLTNRVHYGREPHIIRLRPRLHNIIRSYFY